MYNADKMILEKNNWFTLRKRMFKSRQIFTDSQEVQLTLNGSMVGQINRTLQNQG